MDMSLKKLNEFLSFDLDKFVKDKKLLFIGAEELKNDKKIKTGSKVSVLIFKDNTEYANGEVGLNKKMNFNVKTRQPISYFDDWEEDDEIKITEVEKATVYGDFSNELSVIGKVENLTKKTTENPVVKPQNKQ